MVSSLGADVDLVGEHLGHAGLLAPPQRVGASELLDLVSLPGGALGEDDQHVVGRVVPLLGEEQVDELLEVDRVLGDDAAVGGDVRRVEGGEAGVAPEDPEDAHPLVRADGGALPVDGGGGPGDGGGEADAVLGALHVVVHGLGDAHHLHAPSLELGRRLERPVAADGDEGVDLEPLQVLEDLGGEVVGHAPLPLAAGRFRPTRWGGRSADLGRSDPAGVEDGAAVAVDGPGVLAVQLEHVPGLAGRVVEVHVGEPLEALADAHHLEAVLPAPVDDALDDRVQARDVAAAGEDSDAPLLHGGKSSRRGRPAVSDLPAANPAPPIDTGSHMRAIASALAAVLAVAAFPAPASPAAPCPDCGLREIRIESKVLGEGRVARIRLPEGVRGRGAGRYPVIYVLDGPEHLDHTSATAAYLARQGVMPQVIVVSVLDVDRNRDFTPSRGGLGPTPVPGSGAPTASWDSSARSSSPR